MSRLLSGLGIIEERASMQRRHAVGLQQEIVEDAGIGHQPHALAVLRDITHAACDNRLWGALVRSAPRMRTVPAIARRNPTMTSASSRCPLPATPAIPRISPRRTSRETLRRAHTPRSFLALTSVMHSSTAAAASDFRVGGAGRSRPIIQRARSD